MTQENRYQIDLNFGMSARYHHLCELFYLRVNDVALFLNIALGSAAIGGALGEIPRLAAIAGMLVSLVSALNIVMGSSRKALAHREQYRRYVELEASAGDLSAAELASKLRMIERDDAPILEAFRKRAYLDNLARHGHDLEAQESGLAFTFAERVRLALV